MSAAVQTVTFVNAGLFSVLAVVAFLQWRTSGGRPLLWAAMGFAAIDVVSLIGLLSETPPDGVVRIELVLLVLFPYLLYRFTTAFEQAPAGLERFVGVMTVALVLWSAVLPDIPGPDEAWSNGFVVYIVAFLFHWSILSIIAAVRLWRAGNGQPSVARRRMRFLSAASALLTAAILLAGLGSSEDSLLSLLIDVLAGLSAIGFILGVAPPVILRLLWRRPEVARSQSAIAGLMRAETPDEVTAGVLPAMVALVGARAVELRDASGQIVGSYRPREGNGEGEVEVLDLALPEGSLSVWTSKHAPFFGEEELAILRTLGSLTVLALDRARLFSQEQAARRALEEADQLKMSFVALAAHELRSPVAVIHGVIETLDRRGSDLGNPQRVELDDMLRAQTRRLKDLVEQLLDLSRLDANAVSIEPRKIPVRHRVEEIVAVAAAERLDEVQVDISEELEATVDPNAFDRILSNLVTNALRYGKAPVRISAQREDGKLQIAVEDCGEGVSPEFVPRLFERFARSDATRRRAVGTGLGLAIAHSYAEAHEGELRYCQALPHGARFELVLPSVTA